MELDNTVTSQYTSPYWARAKLEFFEASNAAQLAAAAAAPGRVLPLSNVGALWGQNFEHWPNQRSTAQIALRWRARSAGGAGACACMPQ